MYGHRYLPRKFKVTIAVEGDNSVDVYVDDIGVVVIMDREDPTKVKGYNLVVGGGMGRAHNNEETQPFTAEHLGFVEKEDLFNVIKSIMCVQRDNGRRDDRRMSRFKYVVADKGIDWIKTEIEKYSGATIKPFYPMKEWKFDHFLGWHDQGDGKKFYGLNIVNGRIKNEGDFRLKAALREIVERYNTPVLCSPNQNIFLSEIEPSAVVHIEHIFKRNGVKLDHEVADIEKLHMACPALPMCGLATTEAERITP